MHLKYKFLSVISAFSCAAVFLSLPQVNIRTAAAENDGIYNGMSYNAVDSDNDGSYDCIEITGFDESAASLTIPSIIDGLPVTSIGDEAFYSCSDLIKVTIPSSVNEIGNNAFLSCKSLVGINIPDSVNRIGSGAFGYCKSLTGIFLPDSITAIEEETFKQCDNLTVAVIPDSVKSIGEQAFSYCLNLKNISIPDGVKEIGYFAFMSCQNLKEIYIPESVSELTSSVFFDCSNLTCINVSDENINYSSIDGVLFNKDKTVLMKYPAGKVSFNYCAPNGVKTLASESFYGSKGLYGITIPESVSIIEAHAFQDTSLINNQTGVKYADKWIVECDENITSVKIKNGTKGIGTYAFKDCSKLKEVTIPGSVDYIGEYAFWLSPMDKLTIRNPQCSIYQEKWNIMDNTVVYGYENSSAQRYAERYGKSFVSLGIKPDYLLGDINRSGLIDLYDAIEISKYLMEIRTFSDEELVIADYNDDGLVELYDVIGIATELLP